MAKINKRRANASAERIMQDRRRQFVAELAKYLVKDQVRKSIELQILSPNVAAWVLEWRDVREASTLFGYPTVSEAEESLWKFLYGESYPKTVKVT